MSRSAVLAFVCLASFLVLLPLSLKKPGLPMQLFGDEATTYLMASSLARDGDLRLAAGETERLFEQFPFTPEARLTVATRGDGTSVRYARPLPYVLFAAPFAAWLGANGPVTLNALLLALTIALGAGHLRQWNRDGLALLFSYGFFFFSAAFVYLFRMQPQIFTMAAVTMCLHFAWTDYAGRTEVAAKRLCLSGAALALAIAEEPLLALLAVPVLAGFRRQRLRAAGLWLSGCAATLATLALLSHALTGSLWPSHAAPGESIATFTLSSPLEAPWQDSGAEAEAPDATEPRRARRSLTDLLEDATFLLWGRRAGALPYFPFLIPVLVLFAIAASRTRRNWALGATLAVLAVLQLFLEPVPGHPLQIANPHLVGVYPAFLFLITRLPPVAITGGYALGALLLSTLLLTPFGAAVPGAPLHAHSRNFPFHLLPFEYPSLGEAPGFHQVELHGLGPAARARLWAPADQSKMLADLWLLGGESVELWIESRVELPPVAFNLRNLAAGNHILVDLGGSSQSRRFENLPPVGVTFRLQFEPRRATRVRHDDAGPIYYYRMRVKTRLGEKPKWRLGPSGGDYLGVEVSFLGPLEFLDQDLYALDWIGCGAPPRVAAGEEFLAVARLRNRSAQTWPHRGGARVRLSYRWLDDAGEPVASDSRRTELQSDVEPGRQLASWLSVQAPRKPGRYLLEIDPLFENVAWFSRRNGGVTCRAEVEVTPAG